MCQRLRQEAGISGTGPATVTGQTGEMKRVVDWILAADEDIQNEHATWRFLRESFDFVTIASNQEYTAASVSITDLASWIKRDIRVYTTLTPSNESYLEYVDWDEFRAGYMFGASRTQEERPSIVSIKPNNSLMFWPTPNSALLTVDGEYYKTAVTMTADANTPQYPARFHMAAVWRGLMYYGDYAAAPEKYEKGEDEFNRLMRRLELDQLEEVGYGEPLA